MRKLHVGTMGWSYDFWRGNFYPEKLSPSEFLAYYAKQFNTVEVDSTFYRIPRKKTVSAWKEQTPKGFVFSLKFPQVITHVKMLEDCEEETQVFLERVELLEEKLGPLLLQFSSAFREERVPLLRRFLESLPKEHRYVVEVRNKKLLSEGFYSVLRDTDVALAWVESPFMPNAEEVTSDFVYVRWEGDRRKVNGTLGKVELDKKADIKLWSEKLKGIVHEKMECFGYFSKYYSGFPPSDVRELTRLTETKQ